LQQQSVRTLPEAFQYIPGVLVQKTTHGHGSPIIRGFTGRQNLLLVDGIRANNSTFRGGPVQYWNTFDPLAIDRIEIIKSQGSVLYGSDAIGGTVNNFTRASRFRDEPAGQAYIGGSAFYEYRSNGQGSHIGRLEAQTGVGGKFGILLGTSAKDYGDIESNAIGRMKNTGYPEQNFDFRFDWAASPESTVTFVSNYINQDDISRWHRTLDNPGWTDGSHVAAPGKWTANTYDQERSMTYLRYATENPQAGAIVRRWSATVSFQSTADSEFQNRLPESAATNTGVLRRTHIGVDTTGIDLALESAVGPGLLTYGFDFYHDDVDSTGLRSRLDGTGSNENLPIADDSTYDLFGLYAQYAFKPIEKFELTVGSRHTHAEAKLGRFAGGQDISREWDDVVSSLRGLYFLTDSWSLYGGASQAFRAPNLDDLSGNLASRSGLTVNGNTDLEPETYITCEIGTRHDTATTAVNAAVFYTDVDNLITSTRANPSSSSLVAINGGQGYVYGVELEGSWRFHPLWTLSGFAAWQEGETESPTFIGGPQQTRPNTRQLPLSGSVALRWQDASAKFWIEARLLAAMREDRIDPADQALDNQRIPTGGTPGYLSTSLRAGWHIHQNLDLTCAVENVTDEDYRIHGSGQNEAGLGAICGLRLNW
jgi:hemoglobin/transferrin/lactoferrin receptor protein